MLVSVNANTLTAQALLEPNMSGWRSFPRSFAPVAILGDPICLEVEGDGHESDAVVAAHATTFGTIGWTNDDVIGGAFCPGRVPDHLSGQVSFTPWYSGLLAENGRGY
jgi:hypothetical protein